MEKSEIIMLVGIIVATVWLLFCIIVEGEKRKFALGIGILIDIVLFAYCKNCGLLLTGIAGGALLGLAPKCFISGRKYEIAVRELKGKKNVAIVITIFTVMIFLMMGIAHPDIKIDLSM